MSTQLELLPKARCNCGSVVLATDKFERIIRGRAHSREICLAERRTSYRVLVAK